MASRGLAIQAAPDPCPDISHLGADAATIGLGDLTDYLFLFADGSADANWQAAPKGYAGDVAVDGISASERTSGTLP